MQTAEQFKDFSHDLLWRLLLCLILLCTSTALAAAPTVDVRIEGIEGELLANTELLLSIKQQQTHPLLTEGRIKRLHEKADQEIRTALEVYGYYRVKIDKSLEQTGNETWLATYKITLNDPIRLESVNVKLTGEGAFDPALVEIFRKFPLSVGDVLNQKIYEKTKSIITQLTTERGYFENHYIDRRIDIDLEKYSARITFIMDSGPRYRFGKVTLDQDVLDEDYLRRFIPFSQDDPYSVGELIDLQQALSNSDYFHDIQIEPQTSRRDTKEVPVDVKLTPRKRHKYTFGIGYGTDTRVRGKIGWAVPRVNRRGHRFDSEIKASGISQSISANYHIPIGDPRNEQVAFNAAIEDTTTDTRESLIRSIGVSLVQLPSKWRRIISLNYQDEDFTVGGEIGSSTLLMPGVSWTRIWADNPTDVDKGFRVDLAIRGATDTVVSDTTFGQATIGAKLIRSLFGDNRIILRGKAGSIVTNHFEQIPASIRFFAGGSQSVRGFAYESLGPKNEQGEVVGGRELLEGSVELEHQLNAKWAAAVFYDRGNAINNSTAPLEYSAGFGLRWKTPIGPIRVDYASALSRDGHPWRFDINIGPDL